MEKVHRLEGFDENNTIKGQRDQAYSMYYLQSPEPEYASDGETPVGSGFVSSMVYDAVESIKTILLETFSANNDAVMLKPEGDPDVTEMDAWVDHVMRRDCNNEGWLRDTIHEALLAKTGPVRVHTGKTTEIVPVSETMPMEQFQMVSQMPEFELINMEPGPQGVQVEGRLTREKPYVHIEAIPPENFLVRGSHLRENGWDFVGHRTQVTVQDLIEAGFDEDDIARLPDAYENQYALGSRYSRHRNDNTSPFRSSWRRSESDMRLATKTVNHSFRKLDIDGDGQVEIVYVLHGYESGVILDMQVVDDHWYECCIPLPLAHKFHGLSVVDVLEDAQRASTHIWRQVLDNIYTSNRGRRTEIAIGGFADQDEGLHNAQVLGGTVEVYQPGSSYFTEPHIELPKETMPALQALTQEKEARSGLTQLAMGMESKAVSHQNAKDMIASLADMGQQRIAQMARNIAESFVEPLTRRIIDITREHAQAFAGRTIKIDGSFRQINPAQWRPDLDLEIDSALTPDEQQRQVQEWMSLDAYLTENAPQYYLASNKMFVLSQALRYMRKPMEKVLSSPDSPEFLQAQEMMQAEQEAEKQKADMQMMTQMALLQAQIKKLQVEADMKSFAELSKAEQEDEKQELEEEKFSWQQIVDTWERQIEQEQKRGVDL